MYCPDRACLQTHTAQMVVALLDDAARQTGSPGWLVDVGAGYGLQTLAAASRGYRCVLLLYAMVY